MRPRWMRIRYSRRLRAPGRRYTRPATDTRPDPLPDTITTGACPRRAQVRAVKIGPIAARVIHTAIEVLRVVALTTLTVLAAAVAAWLGIRVTRWWLRHRSAERHAAVSFVTT